MGTTEKSKIVYSIKDYGVGFEVEYRDKLFGVFQCLHGEEEFNSIGVGLVLVQKIIYSHGVEV